MKPAKKKKCMNIYHGWKNKLGVKKRIKLVWSSLGKTNQLEIERVLIEILI